jgi:CHASE3 domain sensor protein
MEKFNSLKLKTRIFLGYLVPLILFMILGGVIYSSAISRNQRQIEVDRSQTAITRASEVGLGLAQMVRSVRGQVLFPNEPTYRDTYEKGLQQFQQAAPEALELIDDPENYEKLRQLIEATNEDIKRAEQVFSLLKANQTEQAMEVMSEIRPRDLEPILGEILADELAALEEKRRQGDAAQVFLLSSVTVGFVLAAISSIVLGLAITTWISGQLQQAANEITASSSQIAATMQQQERIASQQASSVNETTTTMDELEASCRQSAEQAQAAVVAAQQALQLAKGGSNAAEQTLEGIFSMEKRVEAIAEQIVLLSEQANQIGTISELVSELANQTNMLALNSSVEAVRAGEHGKGFAVVANEIRKLSDQSQQSADKIAALVSEIQKVINATVMVTDEGTKTVKTTVQVTEQTEQAFAGVTDAVNKVVLNNQQVSLNLKQQVNAIQQVVEAMDVINKGAKETAAGLTQTKVGTEQLNQAALVLKAIV